MPTGSDPSPSFFAITPSDTAGFSVMARAVYVGGDGNVAVVAPNGDAVTFVGAKAGSVIPVNAIRVNATSTTATNLVGLI
jgi:hypothetical protein